MMTFTHKEFDALSKRTQIGVHVSLLVRSGVERPNLAEHRDLPPRLDLLTQDEIEQLKLRDQVPESLWR